MEIKQRGKPPYRVSSGIIEGLPDSLEQWADRKTFFAALILIFDLADGGKKLYKQRIVDAEGNTVFSMDNRDDVDTLFGMDKDGAYETTVV